MKVSRLCVLGPAVLAGLAILFWGELRPKGVLWLQSLNAERGMRALMTDLANVQRDNGLRLRMSDGVYLATDLYLPDTSGQVPTILVRTPYGRTRDWEARAWIRLFAAAGYAVVVQDMRGRWGSGGTFAPWVHAGVDGAATLDWIVSQSWSDGQVGTIGCSASGEAQWPLAALAHPAHRAMVALGSGGAAGELEGLWNSFGLWEGGIYTLATAFGWFTQAGGKTSEAMGPAEIDHAEGLSTLPLRDLISRWRSDPTDHVRMLDGFGKAGWAKANGYLDGSEEIGPAVLIGDTWYDHSIRASLALWRLARRTAPTAEVVIGPGTHCDFSVQTDHVGDLSITQPETPDAKSRWLAFMDRHLMTSAEPSAPSVIVFEFGSNRWRAFERWPPSGAASHELPLAGAIMGLTPDGVARRALVSDPLDPVPSLGGALCCTGDPMARAGPLDQRPIESRPDVLTWTSPPLAAPLILAGPISARLVVSIDTPDADVVVRLTEVFPDGRSITVQEGALRLRYRDGVVRPSPMSPHETVTVNVPLRDISRVVLVGHRLRLHVAGSSFPRLARNLQTGGDPSRETTPRRAEITIHDHPQAPSVLIVTSQSAPRFGL